MQRTSLVVCIMVRAGIHLDNTDPEPILVLVSDGNVKDLAWCTLIQDGHFVKAAMLPKLESKFKSLFKLQKHRYTLTHVAMLEISQVQNKVND